MKNKIAISLIIFFVCLLKFSSSARMEKFNFKFKESTKGNYIPINQIPDSIKLYSPSIEIGCEYANKTVFWGRDFGVKQYTIAPTIVYKTGRGFYFYATEYYWSAMPNKFAKTDLGIGYEKQVSERVYTSVSYERWLNFNGISNVRKALTNMIDADLNLDLNWLNIEPELFFMFGNRRIFQTDLKIYGDYEIVEFSKNGAIFFKPQFITTFANETFLPIYGATPAKKVKGRSFRLVDMEINLPLLISLGNLEFEPMFHYNIPIAALNENISSFSYFSLNLNYTISFKKIRMGTI